MKTKNILLKIKFLSDRVLSVSVIRHYT